MPANITQHTRFWWGTIASVFLTFGALHWVVVLTSFLPQSTPAPNARQPYQPENKGRPAVMIAPGSR